MDIITLLLFIRVGHTYIHQSIVFERIWKEKTAQINLHIIPTTRGGGGDPQQSHDITLHGNKMFEWRLRFTPI